MICLVDGLRVLNLNLLSCKPDGIFCVRARLRDKRDAYDLAPPKDGTHGLTWKCCLDFWRLLGYDLMMGLKPLGNDFNLIHPEELGGNTFNYY